MLFIETVKNICMVLFGVYIALSIKAMYEQDMAEQRKNEEV